MNRDALIVGGGIAGIWTAIELSNLGFRSVIVEKAPFLGGHVAGLSCKATDGCRKCGACTLEDAVDRLNHSTGIDVLHKTTLMSLGGNEGEFRASLLKTPSGIITEKCSLCGACRSACPVTGAIESSPVDGALFLDESLCQFFKDGSCGACKDACPDGAVDLESFPITLDVSSSCVIIATGFKAFDPRLKSRFGYGFVPGVLTSLELDKLLRNNDPATLGNDSGPGSVAFIQCVGSRDPKLGRNYCSQVCCGNAIRLAELLKHRYQSIDCAIFYMDIQNFDRNSSSRRDYAERHLRMIRAIPSEVRTGTDGRPQLIYQDSEDKRAAESFDMVVLSIGMSPPTFEPGFPSIGTTIDGFLGRDHGLGITELPGVFVVGTANGPKSILNTVSHAIHVGGLAANYIRSSSKSGGALL